MWEIVRCEWGTEKSYLLEGYEPFAVAADEQRSSTDRYFLTYVYLRRAVTKSAASCQVTRINFP